MKKLRLWICLPLLTGLFLFIPILGVVQADEFKDLPVKGMVTMLDLGAKKCIPCKMMAPIMEKMERKYEGKAAVVFIDVWEHREQAARFRIRAIPTQIFFNADGKEVYRHSGFMSEKAIVYVMEKLGVKP
ncbi:MAG: thioredoxin family protein [Desulfobacterales bacterium]|nr:thioredoxin family protein [Desulfobacterales bacterium]